MLPGPGLAFSSICRRVLVLSWVSFAANFFWTVVDDLKTPFSLISWPPCCSKKLKIFSLVGVKLVVFVFFKMVSFFFEVVCFFLKLEVFNAVVEVTTSFLRD